MVKDLLLVLGTVILISIPSTWWPVQAYVRKSERVIADNDE